MTHGDKRHRGKLLSEFQGTRSNDKYMYTCAVNMVRDEAQGIRAMCIYFHVFTLLKKSVHVNFMKGISI